MRQRQTRNPDSEHFQCFYSFIASRKNQQTTKHDLYTAQLVLQSPFLTENALFDDM